jgi:rhodanese-related sulfurtransferase
MDIRDVSWEAVKALIRTQFPRVKALSVAELAAWLQQPPLPLLLDARSEAEYAVSHLPQAQPVPTDSAERLSFLKTLSPPIVVYCSVGYRSAKLTEQIQALGLDPVFNLEGSIFEWANAGHPVYRNAQVVQQVHPYHPLWGKLLDSRLHAYE